MPDSGFPIHDLFVKPLAERPSARGQRLPILSYRDHLLRRFGMAEIVRLKEGAQSNLPIREIADEIWALTEGQVEFRWEDRRKGSPTKGAHFELRCDQPTLVLVPFGVSFRIRAMGGPAQLLRLATHEDRRGAEAPTKSSKTEG